MLAVAVTHPTKRGASSQDRPTSAASSADPVVELAQHCLALHRENERLHRRYGTVEAWLADNHDWFKLTEAQQRALPAGRKLHHMEERFAALAKEQPRAMRKLRRTRSTSIDGAIGKLAVVAAAIAPDEFPSAHRLLKNAITDLRVLHEG
ncbi:MAG: hypothetical protein QM759_12435 [Terricaulis sp.]